MKLIIADAFILKSIEKSIRFFKKNNHLYLSYVIILCYRFFEILGVNNVHVETNIIAGLVKSTGNTFM